MTKNGELLSADPLARLVGDSPPMRRVAALLARAADTDATVLFTGETGTGKGLCAELLHRMSARKSGPFVVVDGTVLHNELALSQLFGHSRGAFTGAVDNRQGMVPRADGGTLFIDEIGDASQRVQGALLRLVDEKRYQVVGEGEFRRVDCRVVCATRRRLADLVAAGTFRDDLLWRIRCIEIGLPPLRERGGDVLTLSRFFLAELAARTGRRLRLGDGVEAELLGHSWPGNVRELFQRFERAAALAESGVITAADLGLPATGVGTAPTLEELERQALERALHCAAGCQRQAARLLGISESSLRSKLRKHGLPPARGSEERSGTGGSCAPLAAAVAGPPRR